jgi:glucose/arabinose dehydrogenase
MTRVDRRADIQEEAMRKAPMTMAVGLVVIAAGGLAARSAMAQSAVGDVRTGEAAFGDYKSDAPGVVRKITPADMPAPMATSPSVASPAVSPRPAGAVLKTLPGFAVEPFAKLDGAPRLLRVAPNGDVFVAETAAKRIVVLRAKDGAASPDQTSVFAENLDLPFGIAFYPAVDPKWVYVADINSVIRFPYASGDLKARGPAEVVIPKLAASQNYHSTRDIVFSPDGKRMFVSVGSGSNVAEEVAQKTQEETKAWAADHALGADWGPETNRADVLTADPDGKDLKVFAAGIRNCVGLAVQPRTGALWCSTNERDMLGDNLPPDYVTHVQEGGFYGWPWYYIGDHEDPRPKIKGQRPDLAGKAIIPDVLIQPHSAPLQEVFYTAASGPSAFPAGYRGDLFVALHGSWNRGKRTGYKVVLLPFKDGVAAGTYEDFLTGFVVDDKSVWGRPVGVAVAHDGALLVSDDGGSMIWRVSYKGSAK